MELFGDMEAVKFPEENLIFVTSRGFIYYIYNIKYQYWRKYRNAGNDYIAVKNYPDVSREELTEVMSGIFPTKETDFMRLCDVSGLRVWDMLRLLREDYPYYMETEDNEVRYKVTDLLLESDIPYKSYEKIRKLFDEAVEKNQDKDQVVNRIRELSESIIGRDIFKKEIGIVDGHDSSSYFWIMPVRVIDYSNTDTIDNVAEMKSNEISIEEDDVAQYLTPFLYKYFDKELLANKQRIHYDYDVDDTEEIEHLEYFEWYLTHNFYTYDSFMHIISDMKDTIDALLTGKQTEYTKALKVKRGSSTHQLLYARDLTPEQIKEYNDNRPIEDDTEVELIIDFYKRFIYRLEYMINIGKEKGYDLISVMGP